MFLLLSGVARTTGTAGTAEADETGEVEVDGAGGGLVGGARRTVEERAALVNACLRRGILSCIDVTIFSFKCV